MPVPSVDDDLMIILTKAQLIKVLVLPLQIDKEAVKVHPHLNVSRTLLFSSTEMQGQFHIWMDKFEAVRWQSRLALGIYIMHAFQASITRAGCGWFNFFELLTLSVLPAARVALEMRGDAKQDQSICSVLAAGYLCLFGVIFEASNDACHYAGAPHIGTSLAAAASFGAITTVVNHFVSPCTMQHLTELCWTIGIGNVAANYTMYLGQNGGLNIWKSDPKLYGLLALVFGMSFSTLVVYCTRVFLAKNLLIAFLKSIRRNR